MNVPGEFAVNVIVGDFNARTQAAQGGGKGT